MAVTVISQKQIKILKFTIIYNSMINSRRINNIPIYQVTSSWVGYIRQQMASSTSRLVEEKTSSLEHLTRNLRMLLPVSDNC